MNKLIHHDKTTPIITKQLIFDRVAIHLLTQNRQALNETKLDGSTSCRYRSNEGLTCAVGCLIDEHLYSTLFEGEMMPSLNVSSDDELSDNQKLLATALSDSLKTDLTRDLISLLSNLQSIHDFHEPKNWKAELIRLAGWLKLSTKAITDWEEQRRHTTQQLLNGCDPV